MSPDLNPIEEVWNILKKNIANRPILPRTVEQLCSAIQEEWQLISVEFINKLVGTMPNCVQEVLSNRGAATHY